MKSLVVYLTILLSSQIVSAEPSTLTASYRQIEYICSEYDCQVAIYRKLTEICSRFGDHDIKIIEALQTAPTTERCTNQRGSWPFCYPVTPYLVTYKCR